MVEILNKIKRFEGMEFTEGQAFEFVLPVAHSTNTEKAVNSNDSGEVDKIHTNNSKLEINRKYKVTVKKYMTEKASPAFDFMLKWNNDKPMPLRTMVGTVIKETRGMVYMQLEGKAEVTCNCLVCAKSLTNPISKLYGIGPECSAKIGLIRIESEDEAREKWSIIEEQLSQTKWEGWVIRSAITESEVL